MSTKMYGLIPRKPGMGRDEFHDYASASGYVRNWGRVPNGGFPGSGCQQQTVGQRPVPASSLHMNQCQLSVAESAPLKVAFVEGFRASSDVRKPHMQEPAGSRGYAMGICALVGSCVHRQRCQSDGDLDGSRRFLS